jgi:hypothetical protein
MGPAGSGRWPRSGTAANKRPWILHRHDAVLTRVAAHVCREHDDRGGAFPVDMTLRCGHVALLALVAPQPQGLHWQRPATYRLVFQGFWQTLAHPLDRTCLLRQTA